MYLNHDLTEDFTSIQKTIGILNAIKGPDALGKFLFTLRKNLSSIP